MGMRTINYGTRGKGGKQAQVEPVRRWSAADSNRTAKLRSLGLQDNAQTRAAWEQNVIVAVNIHSMNIVQQPHLHAARDDEGKWPFDVYLISILREPALILFCDF